MVNFLEYTITGHSDDGVNFLGIEGFRKVHDHWARRRRGGFLNVNFLKYTTTGCGGDGVGFLM